MDQAPTGSSAVPKDVPGIGFIGDPPHLGALRWNWIHFNPRAAEQARIALIHIPPLEFLPKLFRIPEGELGNSSHFPEDSLQAIPTQCTSSNLNKSIQNSNKSSAKGKGAKGKVNSSLFSWQKVGACFKAQRWLCVRVPKLIWGRRERSRHQNPINGNFFVPSHQRL